MHKKLDDVRRMADEVVNDLDPSVHVVAATGKSGTDYTEIVLSVHGCRQEPCTMVLGVSRNMPDQAFRTAVADSFRRHREQHDV